MNNILEIEHVTKRFTGHTALDDVSLTIPEGKIYGLLGPNGAGKTTLIRIINHITAPDSGRVLFQGHQLREEDVTRIGYLPEEYSVTIDAKGDDTAEPYVLAHENNAVEIGFLPVGEYTASLSLDGFKPWSEDVNLTADVAATAALEELTTVPFGLSVTHQDGENGHEYLFKWNEQDPMANYIDAWRVVDFTVSLDGETYADNVKDNSLVFTGVEEGEHTAGVKANYVSGTTDEATVKFLGLSGVGGVKAMAGVAGLTGAIRVSVAGEAPVTVYNASGVAVASASLCDETVMFPAAPGIYLVAVGAETVKVSVR